MTDYSKWDAKASKLCRDADEEEKAEEAACNDALGLKDGPKGPTTEKAEKEIKQLKEHSEKRESFIAWSKEREVSLCHKDEASVTLSGPEVQGKAVRLKGSKGVNYVVPAGTSIVKLMVDACREVRIHLQAQLLTSTVELYKCEAFELQLDQPLGTLQVDECVQPVKIIFAEREHVGKIYHQNSPGLALSWALTGTSEPQTVGQTGDFQLVSRICGDTLRTDPVRRGEGEFPIDIPTTEGESASTASQVSDAEERRLEAEKKRLAGNDMFRASDFAQAAALYTLCLELDPQQSAVWSNRAQCWLKLGDHEKALADATKCTEVDPSNPKGWFRKGMSYHAMKRYPEAIPALLEAEKLEPTNKQILDAIKMAQLMARNTAGS
eukprot:TRINITY_DN5207_c0_g1_i1.p1 TRINITY_DN5207_c0_g1~~TRINITY_DN5207_c0_g1_i1.p1  ORF type:complete len:380 (-),score=81.87 TRINITY_DN5207_c0_g1_i1:54-1193(-)